eukprot:442341-Prorocentrum_lima.AAC.1
MDDTPARRCGQDDMYPANTPHSNGVMAAGAQMDDDAWMSLPPDAGARSGCTDQPWPAWNV